MGSKRQKFRLICCKSYARFTFANNNFISKFSLQKQVAVLPDKRFLTVFVYVVVVVNIKIKINVNQALHSIIYMDYISHIITYRNCFCLYQHLWLD